MPPKRARQDDEGPGVASAGEGRTTRQRISQNGALDGSVAGGFRLHDLPRGEDVGQLVATPPILLPSESLLVEQRGISVRWLRKFYRNLQSVGFQKSFKTRAFVHLVPQPLSQGINGQVVRLFDLVPAEYRGPATVFVSHAWDDTFTKLCLAVQRNCLEDYVWLDMFAIAQQQSSAQTTDIDSMADTVRKIANTKLVVDVWGPQKGMGMSPLTRSWCMFEVAHTPHDKLSVISPPTVGGLTKEQHVAAYECCCALSTKDAQAMAADDKEKIDRLMLRKFVTWEQADSTLQGLIISSLGRIPLHKATKEFSTNEQREAFLAHLWRPPVPVRGQEAPLR